MGYVSFRSETYVSLGMVKPRLLPYWSGSTAIVTMDDFIITARMVTHHIRLQHIILVPIASYSRLIVLWSRHHDSYDSHDPHVFPFISPTLPGLSLGPHSFDDLSLSRLCSSWLSPPHSLCHYSIFIYGIISLELFVCHGHSSIYSVVAVRCSSSALIS